MLSSKMWSGVATGVAVTAVLATSACGGAPGGASGEASSALRVSAFGNDKRCQLIDQAAQAFSAANSDIEVELACTGFGNYFDKLATEFAAKDAADVVMLSDSTLAEYAERGALDELGDSVDLSNLHEVASNEGQTPEGRFGVAAGLNTMSILANPALFESAGVEMPDDTSWTWEEYAATAAEITEATGGETYGSDAPNFGPALELWLRQDGKSTYTEDGQLGFTTEDATAYFTFVKSLSDDGAIPPASVVMELHESLELSGVATQKSAMGWYWNSALGAITTASGADLEALRPPSTSGSADQAELYVKPDSLWSVNSGAENTDLAREFVDFMVNDAEAGGIILGSLGVPANTEVRSAIAGDLEGADKASLEYLQEIEGDLGEPRPPIPVGGGTIDETIFRIGTDVLFDRQSPEEAGQAFVDAMSDAIAE